MSEKEVHQIYIRVISRQIELKIQHLWETTRELRELKKKLKKLKGVK